MSFNLAGEIFFFFLFLSFLKIEEKSNKSLPPWLPLPNFGHYSWLVSERPIILLLDNMLIKMLIILLDYLFLKKINFFEVKSNYSVLSITAIQQSDSVIYIYFFSYSFPLWLIIGYWL